LLQQNSYRVRNRLVLLEDKVSDSKTLASDKNLLKMIIIIYYNKPEMAASQE